eukprot:848518_1
MLAMFTNQTTGTAIRGVPPGIACAIFWCSILWLAMMEGGQGALVGLQPLDRNLYSESHPRAAKCTAIAHDGDNMERFIVGRQFLVIFVIFAINTMANGIEGASVLGLPDIVCKIFLSEGLAVIAITIIIGQ